jgi:hypothetical protein
MPKLAGGCLCGTVRYTAVAEPTIFALCNCTHCQKQSGAAFSVKIGIPKGALKFTSEKRCVFEDKGSSGMPVYRHFCAKCGSPIYSDVVAIPGLDFIKAGSLDDSSWLKPTISVWCESAQHWVKQPEGMASFAQIHPPADGIAWYGLLQHP